MKLTNEDIDRLTIDNPTNELDKYAQYGDFARVSNVDNLNTFINEYKVLFKEQITMTFEEIYKLRGEEPIAIHFWEGSPKRWPNTLKIDKDTINIGWTGWTDRKL